MSGRACLLVGLACIAMLAVGMLVNFENQIFNVRLQAINDDISVEIMQQPVVEDFTVTLPHAINNRISTSKFNLPQTNLIEIRNFCYHAARNELQLFTDNDTDMEPFLAKNSFSRNVRMNLKFVQRSTSEFESAVLNHTTSKALLLPNERVLFFSHELPAHCLHDYLFTLFLDSKDGAPGRYYLPRADQSGYLHTCDMNKDWCCFVFTRAGQIDAAMPVVVAAGKRAKPEPLICLSWGLFPVFGRGRYAPDWQRVNPKEILPVYDTNGFNLSHLESLHHKLLSYDDSIVRNRVRGYDPKRKRRVNVLVLDRSADRRRVWINAQEFVSIFASKWGELSEEKLGSLIYLGDQFAELSPLDQARYFHHADVIISPHGAQLSNLIFGVPHRTVAIEVNCLPQPKHTLDWELVWFGTFTTRLKMRFLRYVTENENCEHNIRKFQVNSTGLWEFIKHEGIFEQML